MPSTPPVRFAAVRGKLGGTRQYATWMTSVLSRDRNRCRRCGRGHAQAHHITPMRELITAVKVKHGITRDTPSEAARLFRLCLEDDRFWAVDNGITLCDELNPNNCHDLADSGRVSREELRRLRDSPRWPRQPELLWTESFEAAAVEILRAPLFDGLLTERSFDIGSGAFDWDEINVVATQIGEPAGGLVSIARAMSTETYAFRTAPRGLLEQLDDADRKAVRAAVRRYYAGG